MLKLTRSVLMAVVALLPCAPAGAQTYDIEGVAALEVLQGYRTPQGTHMAAIRIRLKEGWKTYWRAPGGNGIPPRFRWTGSRNIEAVAYHWPAPGVFVEEGIRTIGYKTELILPLEFIPKQDGQTIDLSGNIEFGVCQDVCIPAFADFTAILPVDASSHRAEIQTALAARPVSASLGGVKSVTCTVKPIKDGFRISAAIQMSENLSATTEAIIEFPHPEVWVDQDQTVVSGSRLTAMANLYAFSKEPLVLDRSKLRFTLLGGTRTVDIRGCPS